MGRKITISFLIIVVTIMNLILFKSAYDEEMEKQQYEELISAIK